MLGVTIELDGVPSSSWNRKVTTTIFKVWRKAQSGNFIFAISLIRRAHFGFSSNAFVSKIKRLLSESSS